MTSHHTLMNTELAEVFSFLKNVVPLDTLNEEALIGLTNKIIICYVKRDQQLPPINVSDNRIYIIRKGALRYQGQDAELLGKYGEGDVCTVFSVPDTDNGIKVTAEEDALLYSIPTEIFNQTIEAFPDVVDFFNQTAAQRLGKKMNLIAEEAVINSNLSNFTVADFYHSPLASVDCQISIQQAAKKMTELNYSSLVITEKQEFIGIITDKDIRRRCVAKGLDVNQPVNTITTREVITIDVNNNAFEALTTMTSRNIHHLPVTRNDKVVGMVTATDLINNEGHNAVNITSIIHKASSVEELAIIGRLLPKLQTRMNRLGTTADHVAKSISAITQAFTHKLIEMAKQQLGAPPVKFAWLAAGSQARKEQLIHSDQDNALIFADNYAPEHQQYFASLAEFVCDGLNACGFVYCPGNVMASNPKWRQPIKIWKSYFSKWVETPEPKALMHSSIFFDMDTVYGDTSLLNEVRLQLHKTTTRNSLFIAHLTKNALQLKPPLGFFRDFVLISDGEHKNTLDIKHNGIAPIVDLARIYALQQGISAVNTIERLQQAAGTPSVTRASALNLIDAFEFMMQLRMEHQVRQILSQEAPNNYISLQNISRLEREHLKDAFKVIKTLQDSRQSVY